MKNRDICMDAGNTTSSNNYQFEQTQLFSFTRNMILDLKFTCITICDSQIMSYGNWKCAENHEYEN